MLVIPVFDTLILSNVQINVQEEVFSRQEVENIQKEDMFIIVPIREQKERAKLCSADFYDVGILAQAVSTINRENRSLIVMDTKERVRVYDLTVVKKRVEASYEILPEFLDLSEKEEADMLEEFKTYAQQLVQDTPGGIWMRARIRRWRNFNEAATSVGSYLDMDADERMQVMATDSVRERDELILEGMRRLIGAKEANEQMQERLSQEQKDSYKEIAIRRQIQTLEDQLGELDESFTSEEEMFAQKIEEAGMPDEAYREAQRVLKRFSIEGSQSHEYGMLYDYLDFVTTLTWKPREPEEPIKISKARDVLEKDHYGLEKVKKRVIEQIAVTSLNGKQTGSILLFVGAPGTGKTSMGKSVAAALNREFVRISLGGVRDEADIRGHRRTYVGAMPGRIMEGIRRAGTNNPVVVLDEVDKLSRDYQGNPASALLEVLDPEQNDTFTDHYLNAPYDLSNVFFICTANTTEGIPEPLLDRMEVISLPGYTPYEKYQIGRKYLLKQAIEQTGLKRGQVSITAGALKRIISDYTAEAGVRGLKKQLLAICRYAAVQLAEESEAEDTKKTDKPKKFTVKESDLPDLLDKKAANHDAALKKAVPGVVTGLAWTQAGGEILFVEAAQTKGSGQMKLTGQLGDVMKESAQIAYTLAKANLADKVSDWDKKDIHIHVPEGAVPKDGPSAGVTMYTALVSLLLQKAADKSTAMTGEISLRGEVLPIGGLPEKLMAAHRAGIKTVLIPEKNTEDLKDVPEEIKGKLKIVPVSYVQDVIRECLEK